MNGRLRTTKFLSSFLAIALIALNWIPGATTYAGGAQSELARNHTRTSQPCAADPLGLATDFNVFVFNDLTQQWSDSEGRVAVGGNASLRGFGVGDKLDDSNGARDDLIVGGDLRYTDGQVFNGNAVYGGAANVSRVGFPHGELRQDTPIDFATAETYLQDVSAAWAELPANGKTKVKYSNIKLIGKDKHLNVFTLAGADLAKARSLKIKAPKQATVVVNIDGTTAQMQNFGISLRKVKQEKVLFHFYEATQLTLGGIEVPGTILAPGAEVAFNNGQIKGSLIAASLIGQGETHHHPFAGCLPVTDTPTTPEPEPETPSPTSLPAVGACPAGPIDFDTDAAGNPLAAGTWIDEQWSAWGVHVSGQGRRGKPNQVIVFDSSQPTGNDWDLGTPNQSFGGPGRGTGGEAGKPGANRTAMGNLLILPNDLNGGNPVRNPNDSAYGGDLTFQFDQPYRVDAIQMVDVDGKETDNYVEVLDLDGNPVKRVNLPPLGNNSFQEVELNIASAGGLNLFLKGSGAVSAIIFCAGQEPTATPTSAPTATAVPPTATATNTPIPPTATATNTPVPPTATATNTPVPPTATATNTPTSAPTATAVPPTATATNTPTSAPTATAVPPTATATNTPVPALGSIGDLVWEDGDEDGQYADEWWDYPLEDMTVNLYLDDGDGAFEPGGDDTLLNSAVTDEDGLYLFSDLPEGGYWAEVVIDEYDDWVPTTPANGVHGLINLGPGENFLDADFGLFYGGLS